MAAKAKQPAARPRAQSPRGRDGAFEGLLRDVLAGQAVVESRLQDFGDRLSTTQEDARAARDQSNRISTILEEQNIKEHVAELRAEVRQVMAETRQDYVAANTRLRNDLETMETRHHAAMETMESRHLVAMEALEARHKVVMDGLGGRLKVLEEDFQRREGAKGLVAWITKNAPWLFAVAAAFFAALGLKGKVP